MKKKWWGLISMAMKKRNFSKNFQNGHLISKIKDSRSKYNSSILLNPFLKQNSWKKTKIKGDAKFQELLYLRKTLRLAVLELNNIKELKIKQVWNTIEQKTKLLVSSEKKIKFYNLTLSMVFPKFRKNIRAW